MSAERQHRIRTLCLAGALHAFTHAYQVALLPLYLLMQRDFKFASVGQATSLVTVMMIAYFLPSYPMGVLADRVSRKTLLGWGLLINAGGFTILALVPKYAGAVAAMILAGIGGSFYHPAATAMVARLYPIGTGKALGWVGVGASVGFFVGPLYAGWRAGALEATRGAAAWRQPVLELGLLGIVMAGCFAWLADPEKPAPASGRKPVSTGKIFPTPVLWLFFFAAAFAFSLRDFTGTSMGSLGSLFLQEARGYDTRLAGFAISGIFVASAISNPLFGGLSDRGRKRWTMFLLLVSAALVALFPHVPTGWTFPTLLGYGFFFMASYPTIEAALMESVPDEVRGRVFGLFIMVGGLIGNLSHWVVGHEVERMGDGAQVAASYFPLYTALAGLILLSLLGLPCLHAIRKREHLEPEPAARK